MQVRAVYSHCELSCVPLRLIYVKALTPTPQNVTIFEDNVFKEVINVKQGH